MKTLAIILAAGKGTRMKSELPKVMHKVGNLSIIEHVTKSVKESNVSDFLIVINPEMEAITEIQNLGQVAIQSEQRGTGHAVQCALNTIEDVRSYDQYLILCGDIPFLKASTINELLNSRKENNATISVIGFHPLAENTYGRLILDKEGHLEKITEFKDASDEVKEITLCNSGIMVVDSQHILKLLNSLNTKNASGEFYLTDIIESARKSSLKCTVSLAEEEELIGINSKQDLAYAEGIFQEEMRQYLLDQGVTMIDPDTIYFSYDTVIESDVIIEPNVYFGTEVTIGKGTTIHSFCHFEQTQVGENCQIGPFARLRGKSVLENDCKIGNFVETKKTVIKSGTKASHLTYLGDATIGAKSNIGAGTITCNYDGFNKHQTHIGDHVFIGSNTALVAPITIHDNAMVGAGSVITQDVHVDEMAIARGRQRTIPEGAQKFRNSKNNVKNRE